MSIASVPEEESTGAPTGSTAASPDENDLGTDGMEMGIHNRRCPRVQTAKESACSASSSETRSFKANKGRTEWQKFREATNGWKQNDPRFCRKCWYKDPDILFHDSLLRDLDVEHVGRVRLSDGVLVM